MNKMFILSPWNQVLGIYLLAALGHGLIGHNFYIDVIITAKDDILPFLLLLVIIF